MPTQDELNAAEEAAAKAEAEAKDKEAAELAASGITTDAGKEALRKEREAKRAAEKLAKQTADELAALKAKQAEADAAKAKAEEEAALKRGEHEQVIAATKAENESLKAKLEAAEQRLAEIDAKTKTRIETGVEDLPDDLKKFDPGSDAALDARLKWFETAVEVAAARQTNSVRTPVTPQPNGKAKPDIKPLVHASSA